MATKDDWGAYLPLSPDEVEFLIAYRKADNAGKRRVDRLLEAAERGLLPPAATFQTHDEIDRFLDSLEAQS